MTHKIKNDEKLKNWICIYSYILNFGFGIQYFKISLITEYCATNS